MSEILNALAAINEQQLKLIKMMGAQKSAFTDTAGSYTELHGDGSLFGSQSIERDVITAHYRPEGIASRLPILPSVVEDPRFAILTGYTGVTGNEPTNPCDPAPAGFVKACNTTAQFGRVARDTQTIDITKVMLKRNRGDFTDLVLRGRVLGLSNLEPSGMDERDILNIVTRSEMITAGVGMERLLSQHMWQGSPANNTAGGGYKEFPGLDSQVATGHVDADTNTTCPAVDSFVFGFGYDDVGGTGRDIVEYLSEMEFHLRTNARKMGLDPVQWVIAMRPELWYELSAVWPCRYQTDRCGDSSGTQVAVINDMNNVMMRDEMRNGSYLVVNGNRYPVIVDDGIFEHTNINNGSLAAGEYASSIFMLPLTITGNFPVLYREHLDYRAASGDLGFLRGKETFWTDGGQFIWTVEQNRTCYLLGAISEQRIVLRTPHLAGRIDAVKYSPLRHLRSPYPDDPYFLDGGVSMRADGTKYAAWLS